ARSRFLMSHPTRLSPARSHRMATDRELGCFITLFSRWRAFKSNRATQEARSRSSPPYLDSPRLDADRVEDDRDREPPKGRGRVELPHDPAGEQIGHGHRPDLHLVRPEGERTSLAPGKQLDPSRYLGAQTADPHARRAVTEVHGDAARLTPQEVAQVVFGDGEVLDSQGLDVEHLEVARLQQPPWIE